MSAQSLPRQRNAANSRNIYSVALKHLPPPPEDYLPPGAIRQDIDLGPEWAIRWVRMFIDKAATLEDRDAVNKRMKRGWAIVTPDELPELTTMHKDGMIQDANCVLMKVSRELIQHDVNYYERQAAGAYQSARTEFAAKSSPDDAIQTFSESKKDRVYRGRLPGD